MQPINNMGAIPPAHNPELDPEVRQAIELVEAAEGLEAVAQVAQAEAVEAAVAARFEEVREQALARAAVRHAQVAAYIEAEKKALEAARVPAKPDLSKMKAKERGELILNSMDVSSVESKGKSLKYTVISPLIKGKVTIYGKGKKLKAKDMTVTFSKRIKAELNNLSDKKVKKIKHYIAKNTLAKAKRMAQA